MFRPILYGLLALRRIILLQAESITTVYSSTPNTTFFENVINHPSCSSTLLMTTLDHPYIYSIELPTAAEPSPSPSVLAIIPKPLAGTAGIVATGPDTLAFIVGHFNITARRASDLEVFRLDLAVSPPSMSKIVSIPQSTILSGTVSLPLQRKVVLIADCAAGIIYRLDTSTGSLSISSQDPALTPPGPPPWLGVEGIRIYEKHLYFTNFGRGTYGRMPIDDDGCQVGAVEIIFQSPADTPLWFDDFVMDPSGNAYITSHPDTVRRISRAGQKTIVAQGPPFGPLGPTSAVFGEGAGQQDDTLYVVTGDGLLVALNQVL